LAFKGGVRKLGMAFREGMEKLGSTLRENFGIFFKKWSGESLKESVF